MLFRDFNQTIHKFLNFFKMKKTNSLILLFLLTVVFYSCKNSVPEVTITVPLTGEEFFVGQEITFECIANDEEDVILDENIVWESDIDGNIGTGKTLSVTNLTANTHNIKVTVSDLDGESAFDEISITIADDDFLFNHTAPVSGENYYSGEEVTFTCAPVFASEENIIADDITWTSDKDGQIGIGLTFSKSDLSINNHIISISYQDYSTDFNLNIVENEVSLTVLNEDGKKYRENYDIILECEATNANGIEVMDNNITWTSDVDGELGTGFSLTKNDLSVGEHNISVVVTNEFGANAEESFTLNVVDDEIMFETMLEQMTGSFSSEAHADTTTNQYIVDVRLHMVQIWDDRNAGENIYWVYIEQAYASALNNPYRQRIYKVMLLPDGTMYDEIYAIPNASSYLHGYETPELFDNITENDLTLKDGCNVYFDWDADNQTFVGSTDDETYCATTIPGVDYIISETVIDENYLTSWDRGYTNNGAWVMGPDWPYIFDKLANYTFVSSK